MKNTETTQTPAASGLSVSTGYMLEVTEYIDEALGDLANEHRNLRNWRQLDDILEIRRKLKTGLIKLTYNSRITHRSQSD
jgi:hypothetical protein